MAFGNLTEFPVGTWGHFPFDIEGLTEESVAAMAECGFSLIHTPASCLAKKDEVLKALDICQKYGIKVIHRMDLHWRMSLTDGMDAYRARLKEAWAAYGSHPATAGYFLGDEPMADQLDDCAKAYRIALEELPGMLVHINQNPGYAGKCWDFMKDSGCNFVSFDHYTQMNAGEAGRESFIRNLVDYRKLAEFSGVPMLAVVLAVGHFRYRVPSEDDLRWQFGASLACGANGVFWYNFYNDIRDANYRGAPMTEFGDKTPSYQSMMTIHKRFRRDHADILHNSVFRKAMWISRNYAGLDAFEPADPIHDEYKVLNITSERGTAGIMTYLEGIGDRAGKKYVMVTNNSPDTSDLFILQGPAGSTPYRCFNLGDDKWEEIHPDGHFSRNENAVTCGFWLAPGQFDIFRFE